MKKLAIIGASYLQEPLIQKAIDMGIETHVFAWQCGDVGENLADYFYPISIVEKDEILNKCREIGIDGICTIASDLAAITVNYVANAMGLVANSLECTEVSTNKHLMRERFSKNGNPSPKSIMVEGVQDLADVNLEYPVIVKPLDRSGSRGITKLGDANGLEEAIEHARAEGFVKKALVEEFAEGQEYSVECISWKGEHSFLALTHKYTTGAPKFIETGHLEPAPVEEALLQRIKTVVFEALDSLGITYGASHSELKVSKNGVIKIIEIGGRMGGDFIGSNLVELSTGIDFVQAVIQVALGEEPSLAKKHSGGVAAVRFIFSEEDIKVFERIMEERPEIVIQADVPQEISGEVTDSSTRFGYYLMMADSIDILKQYLPKEDEI
ncbi:MAG: ATP-grasp domain-containing protein [Lachnospiraceae bacterium]|nr:ATP-grasp domain-containing protein [Lachnospiraceae bacterium]